MKISVVEATESGRNRAEDSEARAQVDGTVGLPATAPGPARPAGHGARPGPARATP